MVKEKIIERDLSIFDELEQSKENLEEYKILSKLYKQYPPVMATVGEVFTGVYNGVYIDHYIFSIPGLKDDVRVDNKTVETKFISELEIGDATDLIITGINNREFLIEGSVAEIYKIQAVHFLDKIGRDDHVMARVNNSNPAGYDLDIIINGVEIPAFMPNTLAGVNKLHDVESIVGRTFEVCVESYSESEGTYIVSRRRFLKTLIPSAIDELEIGGIYTGHVTDTAPFGIFIEFNECLTTMIHKSNVREDWQDKIDQIKPGFQVEFYLKEIIRGKNTKLIATQIMRETLWDSIEIDDIIDGVIKGKIKGGYLIELDNETIGMIRDGDISKSYEMDDKIEVYVTKIDKKNRKIYLKPND